jgi:hypothetical protein
MRVVLRALARPWRGVRWFCAQPRAVLAQWRARRQLQLDTNAAVRELHQSGLMAAIHLIEEQRLAREELARDYARLERRLEALERQLAATDRPAAGG